MWWWLGKSIIQAEIAKNANAKGNRVIFIVHRKELCEQIRNTFIKNGVDMNLTSINMVQTLTRRLDKTLEPALIVVDECHHVLSKSYMNIIDYFPKSLVLGFTATPCRLDTSGLTIFNDIVEGVSTRWLIDNRYMADYK